MGVPNPHSVSPSAQLQPVHIILMGYHRFLHAWDITDFCIHHFGGGHHKSFPASNLHIFTTYTTSRAPGWEEEEGPVKHECSAFGQRSVQIIFSNCAGMIGQGPSMVTWTHLATSSGTRLQVRALKHQRHGKWYPTFFCAISRMVILLW